MKMLFTGGLPETRCGAGSMLVNTRSVRAWLPLLLRLLEIDVLLDAPCGDFNWMRRTDLSMVDYIGTDYDREHLKLADASGSCPPAYGPRSKRLVESDIVNDPLPHADLMLCREFLQHLPNAQVSVVLKNFMAGDIPWLLATSHDNMENGDIGEAGSFRPLNLTARPFWLPLPQKWIADEPGSGRILGLWDRADVARCLA